MKRIKNSRAFTLVELIVVITILAILGTIGFLSLQGYSLSARDSARTSDLATISKGFDTVIAAGKLLPQPSSPMVTLTASGTSIGYQWCMGSSVASAVGLSGKMQDPLNGTCYTYEVNAAQNKYQVMSLQESSSNATAIGLPGIPAAYAGPYDTRVPSTRGSELGIVLGTGANLNQPIQEMSLTGLDLAKTTTSSGYIMMFSNSDTSANNAYTGSLFSFAYNKRTDLAWDKSLAAFDPSLVAYWDMETTVLSWSTTVLKDLSGYGNNGVCYNSSSMVNCWSGSGPSFVDGNWTTGKAMYFDWVDDFINAWSWKNGSFVLNKNITVVMKLSVVSQNLSWVDLIGKRDDTGKDGNWRIELGATYAVNQNYERWFAMCLPNNSDWTGWNRDCLGANKQIWSFGKMLNYAGVFSTDSNKIKAYADGIQVGQWNITWPIYHTNNYNIFIAKPNAYPEWSNVIIDEIRIYSRTLSDSEISAIHSATK